MIKRLPCKHVDDIEGLEIFRSYIREYLTFFLIQPFSIHESLITIKIIFKILQSPINQEQTIQVPRYPKLMQQCGSSKFTQSFMTIFFSDKFFIKLLKMDEPNTVRLMEFFEVQA